MAGTSISRLEKRLRSTLRDIKGWEEQERYDKRNILVIAAVALAQALGMKAGFRIDPEDPDWPVALIELPWPDQHLWGQPVTHFLSYLSTGNNHQKGEFKCQYTLSEIDEDLGEWTWSLNTGGYLYCNQKDHRGLLYRFVAQRLFGEIPEGYEVDHIDQDPLNNVRTNIRLATPYGQRLNQRHTGTGRPGASVRRRGNRWQARWGADGKALGTFPSREAALAATEAHWERLVEKAHAEGHYIYPSLQLSWHLPAPADT